MAEYKKYRSVILVYDGSTQRFQVGTSGSVGVFTEGSTAGPSTQSIGTGVATLNVRDIGSFAVNNYALIGLTGVTRLVTAVAATQLTFASGTAVTGITAGTRIINIGTSANRTASLATIYAEDSGTVTANNPVACDANGNYEFYASAGDYDLVEMNSLNVDLSINDNVQIFGNDVIPDAGNLYSLGSPSNYYLNLYVKNIRGGTSQDLTFYRNSTSEVFSTISAIDINAGAGTFWINPKPALAIKAASALVLGYDGVGSSLGTYNIYDPQGSKQSSGTQYWYNYIQNRPDIAAIQTAQSMTSTVFRPFYLQAQPMVGPASGKTATFTTGQFDFNANTALTSFLGTLSDTYGLVGTWGWSSTGTHTAVPNTNTTNSGVAGLYNMTSASGTSKWGRGMAGFFDTEGTATGGTHSYSTGLYAIKSFCNCDGAGMSVTDLYGINSLLKFGAGTVTGSVVGFSQRTELLTATAGNPGSNFVYGILNQVDKASTGTVTNVRGIASTVFNTGSGTATNVTGWHSDVGNTGLGTVTTIRSLHFRSSMTAGTLASGGNMIGIDMEAATMGGTLAGTNGYVGMQIALPSGFNATANDSMFGLVIGYPPSQTTNSHSQGQLKLTPKAMGGVDPAAGNLPAANATTVGTIINMNGAATMGASTAAGNLNGPYICVQTSAGVYAWKRVLWG